MTGLLLTEPQAAAHLAICPRTLRKARQQGQVTYVLFGRAVRYTLDDLAAFVDSHRQKEALCSPAAPAPKSRQHRATGVIVPFTQRR